MKAPSLIEGSSASDGRIGKRRTLCELQEEEKVLLGEKNELQKEMELRRKAYGALEAENQRLKSQQISFEAEDRVSVKSTAAASSSSSHFILPDLNEPPSEIF
ncbi:uncharacterized protein LOC109845493 [Asparagus officinalis]|nr:uncharacterized protein LOC109845493 [Asparagus officinalis]